MVHNAVLPSPSPLVMQVDSANGKLYWFDSAYAGFRRCNLDGSQIDDLLVTGNVHSAEIDPVNGFFYWALGDELYRAPIDASAPPAVIVTDPDVFLAITGKALDVAPELDLITWVVSGGASTGLRSAVPGRSPSSRRSRGWCPTAASR